MAYTLAPNGTKTEVQPENGKDFKLEEMQKIVGGYIEVIPTNTRGEVMILNEEGKFTDLAYNPKASELVTLFEGDFIVGNVLVCNSKMIK